ncbi:hypothetical protein [Paracoccus fontiphilus]|uniref:Uncharacterized protein n=1 Tax=Paracoccus fontiphilus TaxID=1815556 RepID=A0ABV7ICX3_9RHOB|nr:hypothetical protein [Paracoccus fontiphilus]
MSRTDARAAAWAADNAKPISERRRWIEVNGTPLADVQVWMNENSEALAEEAKRIEERGLPGSDLAYDSVTRLSKERD